MTLAPLLAAPLAVQLHLVTIALATLLAPVILVGRKGTAQHRIAGRVWVAAMASTALVSFAIPSAFSPVHLGPIHLLAVFVLWTLWEAVRDARAGRIAKHRATMRSLAFWALVVTGAFTLLPGRTLSSVVFGG